MGTSTNGGASGPTITDAERHLLRALLEGHQDKQIAHHNDIPLHRVKYQLRTLYDKIGVNNRTQAALRAKEILRDTQPFSF